MGAKPPLKTELTAHRTRNAESAIVHGQEITDTIADWVHRGVVAGPFDSPPFKKLQKQSTNGHCTTRENPASSKYVSTKGNDAIDETKLRKITMSSARKVSYSILAAGRHCTLSKYDLKDAYKNIPCHPAALHLQGFQWLGKSFTDTTSVFGSKAAPSDFDGLGETLARLAQTISKLPAHLIHRILDDTPTICPAGSPAGLKFGLAYRRICHHIGVELASMDPDLEKAFENQTSGTILGIRFDTASLSWSLPPAKAAICLNLIHIHTQSATQLDQLRVLIGHLEAVALMAPFLKGFRWNLFNFLKMFKEDEEITLPIPQDMKKDLQIIVQIVKQAAVSLPIAIPTYEPPLGCFNFVSDAAGRRPPGSDDTTGVSSLGIFEGHIWFATAISWPLQFTWLADSRSALFKAVGLLLPFLILPNKLAHRRVHLHVDNMSLVWAWRKRHMKDDVLTSILLRTLHIIEAALPCKIYVSHLPRVSNSAAKTADNLSRRSTTTAKDEDKLTHPNPILPEAFQAWLAAPTCDWSLPLKIVLALKNQ